MRKALVTGGTGFIARHLIKALTDLSVDVLVSSRVRQADSAGAVALDITDAHAVRALIRKVQPSVIFNLAGGRSNQGIADKNALMKLNSLAAINMAKEAAALGVSRLILVGSAEEYGDQPMPVVEAAPSDPQSSYGESKASMTQQALALHQTAAAPVVVVRPFSVYGPGAPPTMFVAEAADCAARGQPFQMTDGMQKRDLIYVRDVVDGLIAAAIAPDATGQVFNLGSGVSHALRDVAKKLWEISGSSAELLIGVRDRAPGDLMETRANVDKAKRVLGWVPRVSLEDGLLATWLAARQRAMGA